MPVVEAGYDKQGGSHLAARGFEEPAKQPP
jgi:putative transposase